MTPQEAAKLKVGDRVLVELIIKEIIIDPDRGLIFWIESERDYSRFDFDSPHEWCGGEAMCYEIRKVNSDE